jgi:hypothetical protein
MLADQIRSLADREGVPALGFGPAAAMAGERPGHRPQDLLPGAQSLICFGLPVPRGAYQASGHAVETVWRSQNLNYRLSKLRFYILILPPARTGSRSSVVPQRAGHRVHHASRVFSGWPGRRRLPEYLGMSRMTSLLFATVKGRIDEHTDLLLLGNR